MNVATVATLTLLNIWMHSRLNKQKSISTTISELQSTTCFCSGISNLNYGQLWTSTSYFLSCSHTKCFCMALEIRTIDSYGQARNTFCHPAIPLAFAVALEIWIMDSYGQACNAFCHAAADSLNRSRPLRPRPSDIYIPWALFSPAIYPDVSASFRRQWHL